MCDWLDAANFTLSALFIYNGSDTNVEQNERERGKKYDCKWRSL
jgi:hypothetical protein